MGRGEEPDGPGYDVFWSKAQELGAFLFMHPGGTNGNGDPHFAGRGALPKHDRQPARDDDLLFALDLRGDARQIPGPEDLRRPRRRLPAVATRSHRCAVPAAGRCLHRARSGRSSDYFKTQLMADIMVFREEGLRHLVAELGTGQLVYGTDMPFGWPVTPDFIPERALP